LTAGEAGSKRCILSVGGRSGGRAVRAERVGRLWETSLRSRRETHVLRRLLFAALSAAEGSWAMKAMVAVGSVWAALGIVLCPGFGAPGDVLWAYQTGGMVESSSPAVSGGCVYVGSHDYYVYCLDAATGALVWAYQTGDKVQSSPVVSGGCVYVGSNDNRVYCLDAATGAPVWSYHTGQWVRSSPAVSEGLVYVGSRDHKVYCLDAATGALVWYCQPSDEVNSSPAVSGGHVYIGSADNNVYCLDAATGGLVWSYTTGDNVSSSPAVSGGYVYAASQDDKVYCLDALTGALEWSYQTGNYILSSPAVSGSRVYVGGIDDEVYCLDAGTGAEVWRAIGVGYGFSSSPAVSGGYVYIGSRNVPVQHMDNVHCLDAATGALVWSYQATDEVKSSPAVCGGYVYVGSNDGCVYCIQAAAGDPGEWPMFRHDVQRTGEGASVPDPFEISLNDNWNLIGYMCEDDSSCALVDCQIDDGSAIMSWNHAVAAGLVQPYVYYYVSPHGYRILATAGGDDDSWRSKLGYWLLNQSGGPLTLRIPR